jgi:hypothetical protein
MPCRRRSHRRAIATGTGREPAGRPATGVGARGHPHPGGGQRGAAGSPVPLGHAAPVLENQRDRHHVERREPRICYTRAPCRGRYERDRHPRAPQWATKCPVPACCPRAAAGPRSGPAALPRGRRRRRAGRPRLRPPAHPLRRTGPPPLCARLGPGQRIPGHLQPVAHLGPLPDRLAAGICPVCHHAILPARRSRVPHRPAGGSAGPLGKERLAKPGKVPANAQKRGGERT